MSKKYFILVILAFFSHIDLALAKNTVAEEQDEKTKKIESITKQSSKKKFSKLGKIDIQSKQFADWTYRCVGKPSEKVEKSGQGNANINKKEDLKQCKIIQVSQAKYQGKKLNIMTITIAQDDLKKNKPLMSIMLPLNVNLPNGLSISLDKRPHVFKFAFRNCNNSGCWIVENASAKIINAFKRAKTGYAKFKIVNGQNVTVKFSLKGFKRAYEKISKK